MYFGIENKLFALNFSATQELDRQQQADKAKITSLETEVASLKGKSEIVPGKVYKAVKLFLNLKIATKIWKMITKRN